MTKPPCGFANDTGYSPPWFVVFSISLSLVSAVCASGSLLLAEAGSSPVFEVADASGSLSVELMPTFSGFGSTLLAAVPELTLACAPVLDVGILLVRGFTERFSRSVTAPASLIFSLGQTSNTSRLLSSKAMGSAVTVA